MVLGSAPGNHAAARGKLRASPASNCRPSQRRSRRRSRVPVSPGPPHPGRQPRPCRGKSRLLSGMIVPGEEVDTLRPDPGRWIGPRERSRPRPCLSSRHHGAREDTRPIATLPDRRGGDFLDRLDHAPGGSLGAAEEGRPVRQDRPHLPHSARNRLKQLQASRGGAFLPRPSPRHHRKPDPRRSPRPRPMHGSPPCPTSPRILMPCPAPGAAGRAGIGPRRCTRPVVRRQIAASLRPTAPWPRSGRIPIPDAGRSRERRPASRPGHDARPAVHFHRGELTLRARIDQCRDANEWRR